TTPYECRTSAVRTPRAQGTPLSVETATSRRAAAGRCCKWENMCRKCRTLRARTGCVLHSGEYFADLSHEGAASVQVVAFTTRERLRARGCGRAAAGARLPTSGRQRAAAVQRGAALLR